MRTRATLLSLPTASVVLAQDIPFPKPGKNHELPKQPQGTWDSTAKFFMEEGKPPQESKR